MKPQWAKRRIQRAGTVALGQDEPVALGIGRVLRVDVEHRAVQRGQDVGDGEVAADVAQLRPADHLDVRQAHLPSQLGDRRDCLILGRSIRRGAVRWR